MIWNTNIPWWIKIPFCSVIIELLTFCRKEWYWSVYPLQRWGRKCTNIKSNGNRCWTSPTAPRWTWTWTQWPWVESTLQLQCNVDELGGKYTEAKPRCTCPSYESNLHQVGEVQHQLPLNLMLVHFRPHLCSGYTDQYHPPDAPLVVVEVDDGVDAAWAGDQSII